MAERLIDVILLNMDKEFVDGKAQRQLLAKVIEVGKLASSIYQPHSSDMLDANQASGYLGRKIE